MSEHILVDQAAPTLAGLKTGNLFTCPREEHGRLCESLRELNRLLVPRGLRVLPVKALPHRVLIYLYRPDRLRGRVAAPATVGDGVSARGRSVSRVSVRGRERVHFLRGEGCEMRRHLEGLR